MFLYSYLPCLLFLFKSLFSPSHLSHVFCICFFCLPLPALAFSHIFFLSDFLVSLLHVICSGLCVLFFVFSPSFLPLLRTYALPSSDNNSFLYLFSSCPHPCFPLTLFSIPFTTALLLFTFHFSPSYRPHPFILPSFLPVCFPFFSTALSLAFSPFFTLFFPTSPSSAAPYHLIPC